VKQLGPTERDSQELARVETLYKKLQTSADGHGHFGFPSSLHNPSAFINPALDLASGVAEAAEIDLAKKCHKALTLRFSTRISALEEYVKLLGSLSATPPSAEELRSYSEKQLKAVLEARGVRLVLHAQAAEKDQLVALALQEFRLWHLGRFGFVAKHLAQLGLLQRQAMQHKETFQKFQQQLSGEVAAAQPHHGRDHHHLGERHQHGHRRGPVARQNSELRRHGSTLQTSYGGPAVAGKIAT